MSLIDDTKTVITGVAVITIVQAVVDRSPDPGRRRLRTDTDLRVATAAEIIATETGIVTIAAIGTEMVDIATATDAVMVPPRQPLARIASSATAPTRKLPTAAVAALTSTIQARHRVARPTNRHSIRAGPAPLRKRGSSSEVARGTCRQGQGLTAAAVATKIVVGGIMGLASRSKRGKMESSDAKSQTRPLRLIQEGR